VLRGSGMLVNNSEKMNFIIDIKYTGAILAGVLSHVPHLLFLIVFKYNFPVGSLYFGSFFLLRITSVSISQD
jgi:hypothetical protein